MIILMFSTITTKHLVEPMITCLPTDGERTNLRQAIQPMVSTFAMMKFPYGSQNKVNADLWAGAWQLSKISLPTGGEINVQYESDDYAYVQNKKAMKMLQPKDLIKVITGCEWKYYFIGSVNNLRDANAIELTAGGAASLSLEDFKTQYLAGSAYLYTKLFVDMRGYDSRGKAMSDAFCDFVSCYAKVVKKHPGTYPPILLFLNLKASKKEGKPQIPSRLLPGKK